MKIFSHQGKITPKQDKTNIILPFSVPNGTEKLIVHYRYAPKLVEDETLALSYLEAGRKKYDTDFDLELFKEVKNHITLSFDECGAYRGACHRQPNDMTVIIGEKGSTPGIENRKITPGQWQMMLNVHFCGCEVSYDIEIEALADFENTITESVVSASQADRPVYEGYIPCELHCHTLHSDGGFTVPELQISAREDGLSLIALTDHNTMSGQKELDDGIIPAIRGIEWTTYFGHMLVLGADNFVDWRDAVPDNIDKKISEVKAQNGLVGIAHPFQLGSPMCTGGRWEFNVRAFDNIDYVEIWHQSFSEDNYENDRATAFWTSLLDKGHRLAATYGRDWHRKETDGHFGCTYLYINGEINPKNAMKAIKNGRTIVSTGAEFHFKVLQNERTYLIGDEVQRGSAEFIFTLKNGKKCEEGYQPEYEYIKIVTNGGECVRVIGAYEKETQITLAPSHWYRAELWGKLGKKEEIFAVTSPIYVKE